MDLSESTKIVASRIQEIEPEHASKIVGFLLLQERSEERMIRLALSPDDALKNVISRVKSFLGLSTPDIVSNGGDQYIGYNEHSSAWVFSPPNKYTLRNPFQYYSALHDYLHSGSLLDSELYNNNYYYQEPSRKLSTTRASRRSYSMTDFPPKVCFYFSKGFCKHGENCRYFHDKSMRLENLSQILGPRFNKNGIGASDYHLFPVGSLERLEIELTELLRSRKGSPVSIASLPAMYFGRYGRTIYADGYLTEGQGYGKNGFSLTKLLSLMKNNIRVIERPHGQHTVILAEYAPKYRSIASDQYEHGGNAPGERQIYLTFPADSEFTEIDVSNHFNTYGPVQDVRIPSQQKRMFGFVTFVYAQTVQKILARGNPHIVCGARVLVKPYREKSSLIDRNLMEKLQRSIPYDLQHFELESGFHTGQFDSGIPIYTGSSNQEQRNSIMETDSDEESNRAVDLPDNPFSSAPTDN